MKKLREANKMTLEALGKKCGVSTNTVWRWEQGKQFPNAETLERIAFELLTSTNYLLGKTDDPSPAILFSKDLAKYMSQDEVTTNHTIIVPFLDYPEALESWDKPPAYYKRFDLTIPLMWIGRLPPHESDYHPFFISVKGNAMAGAGLHEASLALVNPSEPINNGDIVLAFVGPRLEVVVRWYYMFPDGIEELRSPASEYPVFRFPPPQKSKEGEEKNQIELNLRGKVVGAWNSTINTSLRRGM